jgi:succinyl-CoA synthetase beta subunit
LIAGAVPDIIYADMKIHEYQGKAILAPFGVPIPRGEMTTSAAEAGAIARRLGGGVSVVKAQIHAGGRGKGGGVKVVKSPEEAEKVAAQILGMQLVTHQTGPAGQKVGRILVEEGLAIARELYFGMLIDRATQCTVLMASSAGGMDIEDVAEKTPELILKEYVDPGIGLQGFQARKIAFGLGLEGPQIGQAVKLLQSLYTAFIGSDASLVEINPLIVTKEGNLLALDAKVTFDDNAMFRHKDFPALRDTDEEDPLEVEASKYSLNYIRLDGTIGCMVNGAGLAMATMDIIKLAGGEPANFLDVGGGANAEQIKNAFRILMADRNVKGVLINIFGGILRCDVLASGLIAAVKDLSVSVPIVIRMEGTNVEQGKAMLAESGLNFTTADSMGEAAQQIVALSK